MLTNMPGFNYRHGMGLLLSSIRPGFILVQLVFRQLFVETPLLGYITHCMYTSAVPKGIYPRYHTFSMYEWHEGYHYPLDTMWQFIALLARAPFQGFIHALHVVINNHENAQKYVTFFVRQPLPGFNLGSSTPNNYQHHQITDALDSSATIAGIWGQSWSQTVRQTNSLTR